MTVKNAFHPLVELFAIAFVVTVAVVLGVYCLAIELGHCIFPVAEK